MRRVFYVDFENIQSMGLLGVEKLSEEDEVNVLYSTHADSMKIAVVNKLLKAAAQINIIEVETGTPNALDFQLVASLFMHIDQSVEYYIVSKDTGFDMAIHIGEKEGYHIKRVSEVDQVYEKEYMSECIIDEPLEVVTAVEEKCLPIEVKELEEDKSLLQSIKNEKKQKKAVTEIERMITEKCGKDTCEKYSELIVTGVKKSENKNQFYQFFRTNLGDSKGLVLYRNVRDKFKDMKALV